MKDTLKALVFGGLFVIPLLPLYVANDYFFPFITGKNFAFRIIVEIVVAAWVLLALIDKAYRPRFSWIMLSFLGLIVSIFVSSLVAIDSHTSFWSNYERMDGFVSLVHVFLFTLVLGSVVRTDIVWNRWLITAVTGAGLVALYGLGQYFGVFQGGQSRVDSRLGNAAYMAVYMLFNIFFAYILILRSKENWQKVLFGVMAAMFAYTLLMTGTRGTFLGFAGGSVVTVAYIALFARKFPHLRKYAIAGMAVLVLLTSGYFAVRASDYQADSQSVNRILNIDIKSDLEKRSIIWGMAWEGVVERPVFGYGMGNFNYVFNANYKPELWNQEQWFDRVHNIVLDWLIAGGFVGFFMYFSIMASMIYYLFVLPVLLKRETIFSVPEQAILLGLLAGYLLHNLVVFDNIISYIFYAALLALVHSRIARPFKQVEAVVVHEKTVSQFIAPVVILITGFIVYMVNVPGMQAAGQIIDAMRAGTVRERLTEFHNALEAGSFAQQEIVEQLAQQAITIARTDGLPEDEKKLFIQRAELELLKLAENKPGDARIHNFLSSYYRTLGAVPEAREQAAIAVSLSPLKPSLKLEQAVVEIQGGDLEAARRFAEEAYSLAPENTLAAVIYASVLYYVGEVEMARGVITSDMMDDFAMNDYALGAVSAAKEYEFLADLYERRVALLPQSAQERASLAFVYYELGETEKAVSVLTAAGAAIPSFTERAMCYVQNINNGVDPSTPCTTATE